jgi:hypothetical protein
VTDCLYDTTTFDAFWQRYLELHSEPLVRRLHAIATTAAFVVLALALVRHSLWLALAAPLVDYTIAQASHRIRGSATQPFRRPWWHLRAELRLYRGTLRGR